LCSAAKALITVKMVCPVLANLLLIQGDSKLKYFQRRN
jgi:hypothetical protein